MNPQGTPGSSEIVGDPVDVEISIPAEVLGTPSTKEVRAKAVCEKHAEIDPVEHALVAALEAATAAGQWDAVRSVAEAISALRTERERPLVSDYLAAQVRPEKHAG